MERQRPLEHPRVPSQIWWSILRLLEAVHLPTEVSVSHSKGHQKENTEVARGNQTANQAAKRAALQNNDLTRVAILVPQANLPGTPSYTEGETLKAKSEGFQEDHIGWFQKEGLLFLPGSLQWKLVNSFRGNNTTTHLGEKALQRLLERSFRGTGLQTTIRQVVSSCPLEDTQYICEPLGDLRYLFRTTNDCHSNEHHQN